LALSTFFNIIPPTSSQDSTSFVFFFLRDILLSTLALTVYSVANNYRICSTFLSSPSWARLTLALQRWHRRRSLFFRSDLIHDEVILFRQRHCAFGVNGFCQRPAVALQYLKHRCDPPTVSVKGKQPLTQSPQTPLRNQPSSSPLI
jgi:hypothetical protein